VGNTTPVGRKKSGREPSVPIANKASSPVNAGGTAAIINGGKVAGNGQLRGTVKEKKVPQASPSNSFGWFSVVLLGLAGVGVAYVWISRRNKSARYRYQGIPSNAGNFYDDDDDDWGSSPPKGIDGGHARRRSRSQSSDHDILVDTADFDDDDFGDDFDDDLESELRR